MSTGSLYITLLNIMNLIILPRSGSRLYSVRCRTASQHFIWASLLLAIVLVIACAGYWLGVIYGHKSIVSQWKEDVQTQQELLVDMQQQSEAQLTALTQKVAFFQAYINRLDALGNKLMTAADLDDLQIDFQQAPGIGGPEHLEQGSQEMLLASLSETLDKIALELQTQENKFHTLDSLLTDRNLRAEVYPQGRPVAKGWISSHFGKRADPFTGKQEFHRGVDFAGKYNSDVLAVAGGVVTEAKARSGFGNLVEIDHGNGYVTRYGHNEAMLVKVGDAVKKGQPVAKMGSTGRSTGPHVHFEVLKNGTHVDPMKFIKASKKP